jgi:hypothetical protein
MLFLDVRPHALVNATERGLDLLVKGFSEREHAYRGPAVVGLAADGIGAYDACASAADPISDQCAAGLGQFALDSATFGLGGELTGAAAGAFDIASGLGSYDYSQWAGSRSIVSTQSASASYCRGGSVPVYGPSGELLRLSSYGSYLDP